MTGARNEGAWEMDGFRSKRLKFLSSISCAMERLACVAGDSDPSLSGDIDGVMQELKDIAERHRFEGPDKTRDLGDKKKVIAYRKTGSRAPLQEGVVTDIEGLANALKRRDDAALIKGRLRILRVKMERLEGSSCEMASLAGVRCC